jgi:hypothetical protein
MCSGGAASFGLLQLRSLTQPCGGHMFVYEHFGTHSLTHSHTHTHHATLSFVLSFSFNICCPLTGEDFMRDIETIITRDIGNTGGGIHSSDINSNGNGNGNGRLLIRTSATIGISRIIGPVVAMTELGHIEQSISLPSFTPTNIGNDKQQNGSNSSSTRSSGVMKGGKSRDVSSTCLTMASLRHDEAICVYLRLVHSHIIAMPLQP